MSVPVGVVRSAPREGLRSLAATLGAPAAASLEDAFVRDQLATLARAGFAPVVLGPAAVAPALRGGRAAARRSRAALPGEQSEAALVAGLRRVATDGPAVVVNGRVPQLREAALASALAALESADVALGPSPGGGAWMIAVRRLADVWGGGEPGADVPPVALAKRAAARGLRVHVAEPLRAVEAWSDLGEVAPALPTGGSTRQALAGLLGRGGALPALPPPVRLHLEVTNRCNSRCGICVRTLAPPVARELDPGDVERIIAELPRLESVALQVNGEPLVYPHLAAVLALLARARVAVELNTNALALDDRLADQLIDGGLGTLNVSVDGTTRPTYRRLRGVDGLDRVLGNLARFLRRREAQGRGPRVSLWMVATRHNLGDLPALVETAARLGADEVYLQRLVLLDDGAARAVDSVHGRLTPSQEDTLAAATASARRLGVALRASGGHTPAEMLRGAPEPEPWRACRRPWQSAVVMADGQLAPCCIATFTAPEGSRMGDVRAQGVSAAWNGPGMRRLRVAQLAGPGGPEMCRSCGVRWSL